ncbi:MAG TPA: zinc ribbon domain-containing protein [Candidatus Binatia bacterium]|nr:zinc ribbon domain-containing protein [Candidatus Binatia bacterium]
MTQPKSQFRSELAIIPRPARLIAAIVWVLLQIGLLGIMPRYCTDLPPMPWWILISVLGGAILAIVVLMIGYVNADAKRRGMNSLLWTLLVIFVPKALGFLAYFLLRKPLLMPCPNCGTPVGSDFRYCPKCGHAVAPACVHCGRPIRSDYVCCPYCGKNVAGTPVVQT